ncbi:MULTISPECIES: hypothetical protein [Brevibacterium]|uniref:Small multidrug efflux protein n=1 Tax=Brevibacterium salitolerans TaxID=1403566 RepID=A0ABN2WYM5_9MICO|nr:hypothetical protein [Brevibacterium sp.]
MDQLLGFAESFPPALQWLAIMLVSAIPFVESYFGTFLGILAGVPAPLALIAAIVGNAACMLVLVLLADAGRRKTLALRRARRETASAGAAAPAGAAASAEVARQTATGTTLEADPDTAPGAAAAGTQPDVEELSPRRQKFKRAFDRYGVAGVSLFGQAILPSQITSAMMVGFGASRNAVILWQIVGITLWAGLFGLLALGGVNLLGG